jgi:hypothetical protein
MYASLRRAERASLIPAGLRSSRARRSGLLLSLVLSFVTPAAAEDTSGPEVLETESEGEGDQGVESMVVYGRAQDQLGVATSSSEGRVARADLELRPRGRIGEVLEAIPGLIATQHSGPGKSNQLFLRGFNLDHGTDFSVHFDGVPINFRTHGHGQGYLDLNFMIPELVRSLDFRKGPYRADVGDFSSAGASFFETFDQLPDSIASLTVGEHHFVRGLVAANVPSDLGEVVVAVEGKTFDDPFKLDADLMHVNAFAKLTRPLGSGTLRASALGYHAEWNSTDQIPRRAIGSPDPDIRISRLGFEDPDAGGETTRVGATFQWDEEGNDPLGLSTYFLYYRFKLFSNFTYYLDNPVDGDEFSQREERFVWGAAAKKDWTLPLLGSPVDLTTGLDTRLDVIQDIGLTDTEARQRLSTVRRDDVDEWSAAGYAEARWSPFDWMTWIAGVRGDLFLFGVDTRAGVGSDTNSGTEVDALVSPKLSLILRPTDTIALYLNGGGGYHSNDARGTTLRVTPSGETVDPVDPLARQWGAEWGARWQPDHRFHLTGAVWFLTSSSELVYVGDAGETEPQGSSRRYGLELTAFLRPVDWIAFDAAYAISDAEFKNAPSGQDRIPGAIESVLSAGATLTAGPFSGSVRVRHFGAYPLLEDNTERAGSTTLVNLGANVDWGRLRFGVTVINLFDSKDNDIEYYYASRLQSEPAPVEDVHLHPVAPRQVRATLTARF